MLQGLLWDFASGIYGRGLRVEELSGFISVSWLGAQILKGRHPNEGSGNLDTQTIPKNRTKQSQNNNRLYFRLRGHTRTLTHLLTQ